MIIHLFRDGSAMITGKNARTVSTEPETSGRLILGEDEISVEGTRELDAELLGGMRAARFERSDGRIYAIGTVSVKHGQIVSLNAESDTVIKMLHKSDELEEKYEELLEKYQKLKAKVEYDSIGFITGEGEA